MKIERKAERQFMAASGLCYRSFGKVHARDPLILQSFQQRKEGRRPNGYFPLMRQHLIIGIPGRNRTANDALGEHCYIHLTTETY